MKAEYAVSVCDALSDYLSYKTRLLARSFPSIDFSTG
jgi:hypothetical protein